MALRVACFLFMFFLHSSLGNVLLAEPIEMELNCPDKKMLLKAIASRSPFFGDAISVACAIFNENFLSDEEETHEFSSNDEGDISASCPLEHQIIRSAKMTFSDAHHLSSISLVCSPLSDPDRADSVVEVSSEGMRDSVAMCEENSAMQKISFSDAGDRVTKRLHLRCIKLKVE